MHTHIMCFPIMIFFIVFLSPIRKSLALARRIMDSKKNRALIEKTGFRRFFSSSVSFRYSVDYSIQHFVVKYFFLSKPLNVIKIEYSVHLGFPLIYSHYNQNLVEIKSEVALNQTVHGQTSAACALFSPHLVIVFFFSCSQANFSIHFFFI